MMNAHMTKAREVQYLDDLAMATEEEMLDARTLHVAALGRREEQGFRPAPVYLRQARALSEAGLMVFKKPDAGSTPNGAWYRLQALMS